MRIIQFCTAISRIICGAIDAGLFLFNYDIKLFCSQVQGMKKRNIDFENP